MTRSRAKVLASKVIINYPVVRGFYRIQGLNTIAVLDTKIRHKRRTTRFNKAESNERRKKKNRQNITLTVSSLFSDKAHAEKKKILGNRLNYDNYAEKP